MRIVGFGTSGRERFGLIRMRCQKVFDRRALVSREVVGNDVDLFAARLIDHDVGEEGDKLRGRVPFSGLAEHLIGLGVEGRIERQGSMTKVLKAVPLRPAGESGRTGSLRSRA
jgi:hypothetical protein